MRGGYASFSLDGIVNVRPLHLRRSLTAAISAVPQNPVFCEKRPSLDAFQYPQHFSQSCTRIIPSGLCSLHMASNSARWRSVKNQTALPMARVTQPVKMTRVLRMLRCVVRAPALRVRAKAGTE
jgi:hypothetical protein